MREVCPISVVIPTRNRSKVLVKTLNTFLQQSKQVAQIVVVDGSEANETKDMIHMHELSIIILYIRAEKIGAAAQRNTGLSHAVHPFVLFADDDVYLDNDVIEKLWSGMNRNDVGGISAMIRNQKYMSPGLVSSVMYRLMHGRRLGTYAGLIIGPAWNLLPEDREDLPAIVECQWLNTTCTLYRREALPVPAFSSQFVGYSLMEDVALSVIVGRNWRLMNARTSRIYHDSQPGDHKKNVFKLSEMELINRYYLMRNVLGKSSFWDYIKLFVFELFQVLSGVRSRGGLKRIGIELAGKVTAIFKLMFGNS